MTASRWRVCLIVTPELESESRVAIKALLAQGFDGIDVFAPRGVSLPDSDSIIRLRCDDVTTESGLYLAALTSPHGNLVRDVDFVLFIRADILLWNQAKLLMEHTIEPHYIASYFPYAPAPFVGGVHSLPCRSRTGGKLFGWCSVQPDGPLSGIGCFAMNAHTAMLLAGYANRVPADDRRLPWSHLSLSIWRSLLLTCYVHTPSIAYLADQLEDVVPLGAKLDPSFVDRNLYLN